MVVIFVFVLCEALAPKSISDSVATSKMQSSLSQPYPLQNED